MTSSAEVYTGIGPSSVFTYEVKLVVTSPIAGRLDFVTYRPRCVQTAVLKIGLNQ